MHCHVKKRNMKAEKENTIIQLTSEHLHLDM